MSLGASDIRLTLTRTAPRSRNRFSLSRSSGAPPIVTGREAGSRPASCAILRKAGRYSSGFPLAAFGYQPSPSDRAPRRPRKGAAENDRRMRLLHRLGPGHDRAEIDKLAVIFRFRLGPDRLHCFDLLAHLLHTRRQDGAVVL